MNTMTLDEFHAACKAQAKSAEVIVFKCPMCATLQTARELIAADAGPDFDAVERYLGFSCIGRFTGAAGPRRQPDGLPCDWTLGGLFRTHRLEVITPDGLHHPRFELAMLEEAQAHRASKGL
ncbi:VVA0879 family protein [Bordetella flabilis]|uniref:Uncharacterized protein n=1 Tax=Bordetella flabilis TaxID=463014 RepID=A0A193GH73_9BORD|nr:VVA0879 family protein [Bordetella flabilis]ANN78938.1 hypothetical protein BAU07_19045 [Bordetella flabilis]